MNHPHRISAGFSVIATLIAAWIPGCATPSSDDAGTTNQEVVAGECELGDTRLCQQDVDPNQQGIATCVVIAGQPSWGECAVNPDMGKENCDPSREVWDGYCCRSTGTIGGCCAGEECNTPLVITLDGARIETTLAQGATFDLSGHELSQLFDWPTAATPWLALDLDGSGTIDGGHELFGSAVRLASGDLAKNGFEALAEYDANHDGRIDANDPVFSKLVAWGDENLDRVSQPDELHPLSSFGIEALDLDYRITPQCDERGNCGLETAAVELASGTAHRSAALVDLHLVVR